MTERDRGDYYERRRRARAEAEGRKYIPRSPRGYGPKSRIGPRVGVWIPGQPIEIEENDPL